MAAFANGSPGSLPRRLDVAKLSREPLLGAKERVADSPLPRRIVDMLLLGCTHQLYEARSAAVAVKRHPGDSWQHTT